VQKNLKRAYYWAGLTLLIASLYFIALSLWQKRNWLATLNPTSTDLLLLVLAILIYASSQFLLSYAWCKLLSMWSAPPPAVRDCHSVYGLSQIAKYLPGNMMHYVGRHVGGRRLGIAHLPLVMASTLEAAGVISSAALLGLIGATVWYPDRSPTSQSMLLGLVAAALALALLIRRLLPRITTRARKLLRIHPTTHPSRILSTSFFLYLVFFLIAGGISVALAASQDTVLTVSDTGAIVMAFAASWLMGFLTPGAPGGIGVREATLILFLTPITGEHTALLVALALRVVTSLGDLLFFLMTYFIGAKNTPRP